MKDTSFLTDVALSLSSELVEIHKELIKFNPVPFMRRRVPRTKDEMTLETLLRKVEKNAGTRSIQ